MSDADKALLFHALILAAVAVLGLFTAWANAKMADLQKCIAELTIKSKEHSKAIDKLNSNV